MKPDPEVERRENIKRNALTERLTNKKVLLNKTRGVVRGLHVNIDIMRREIGFSLKSINILSEEIDKLKNEAKGSHEVSQRQGRTADETNNSILAMKAHTEKENQLFKAHF